MLVVVVRGVEGFPAVNSSYFADKDDSNKMWNGEHRVDAAPAQTWQQRVGLREGTEAEVEFVPSEFWKRLSSNMTRNTTSSQHSWRAGRVDGHCDFDFM